MGVLYMCVNTDIYLHIYYCLFDEILHSKDLCIWIMLKQQNVSVCSDIITVLGSNCALGNANIMHN